MIPSRLPKGRRPVDEAIGCRGRDAARAYITFRDRVPDVITQPVISARSSPL